MKELDVVTLAHDKYHLKKGESGTIVSADGQMYVVEFVNTDGTTKALLTLGPDDIN